MAFHDLNIAYASDDAELSNTLAFARELEYTTVALAIGITSKLPPQLPQVARDRIKIPTGLRVLTRLTLTLSDPSQNHRINALTAAYDLLALRPSNDKAFQLCCATLDCDIISLDFAHRVPFPLKFKTVASALQRGIRFEVCYSTGIVGSNDARRNLVSGAAALIRATRGRGIILSSEAKNALGLRAPWDAINLAQVWGLSQERGKEAVCEEAGKVVRLAGMKRSSFRGVVDIIDHGSNDMLVEEPTMTDSPQKATAEAQTSDMPQPAFPVPTLRQVTVVPEKASNAKRKASSNSLNEPPSTRVADGKPLSKRELKRQAKKARLDKAAGEHEQQQRPPKKEKSNGFSFQHEALVSKNKG
ncbi:RNA-binding RNA processing protein rpp1 [Neophaeococcomyces mojaviensis]|uniref:RNA-binding RNA processing protein rpp1 n=1 Tax=Neophaeococcomyces mojaviensis TaxID=3383035 RepID=A0ACC3AHX1_9EURO|nr:RNA-binding RNA processing protein rpp1 [Knufia sp. JES_112]